MSRGAEPRLMEYVKQLQDMVTCDTCKTKGTFYKDAGLYCHTCKRYIDVSDCVVIVDEGVKIITRFHQKHREAFNKAKKETKQKEQRLESEVQKLKSRIAQVTSSGERLKVVVNDQKEKIKKASTVSNGLSVKLHEKTREVEELSSIVVERNTKVYQLETNLKQVEEENAALDDESDDLQAQLIEANSTTEKLEAEVDKKTQELEKTNFTVEELKDKVDEKEKALEQARAEIERLSVLIEEKKRLVKEALNGVSTRDALIEEKDRELEEAHRGMKEHVLCTEEIIRRLRTRLQSEAEELSITKRERDAFYSRLCMDGRKTDELSRDDGMSTLKIGSSLSDAVMRLEERSEKIKRQTLGLLSGIGQLHVFMEWAYEGPFEYPEHDRAYGSSTSPLSPIGRVEARVDDVPTVLQALPCCGEIHT